tara:strand:+ start:331 stop:564 length:234 start_codon:yes stop_codon:yes gene_type:complete
MNCDFCGKPILHENSNDELLSISAHPRAHGEGCVTDMAIKSEIGRTMNFHDMRCLSRWAAVQRSPYSGQPYLETPIL